MSLLRQGDKLAIVGDSITEQLRYSRLVETYLHACAPELGIEVRQSGWSGETTGACLLRFDADVLAYKPSFVVTNYGMNDFSYEKFDDAKAEAYRVDSLELIRRVKAAGARHLLASPTNISLTPAWCERPIAVKELNRSLGRLRDLGRALAQDAGLPFCDMLEPMLAADRQARARYGPGFNIAGEDGVHPDWAGHMVMATTELCALGFDGDLGTLVLDAGTGKALALGGGHQVLSSEYGRLQVLSERYPFCMSPGDPALSSTLAAGAALSGFFQRLNRLIFRVEGAEPGPWRLHWGGQHLVLAGTELAQGVNLAELFAAANPFSAAFARIDEAVARKQAFENYELHEVFHGPAGEGVSDPARRAHAEGQRQILVEGVVAARQSVRHELRLEKMPG